MDDHRHRLGWDRRGIKYESVGSWEESAGKDSSDEGEEGRVHGVRGG